MQAIMPIDIEDELRHDLQNMYEWHGLQGRSFTSGLVPFDLGELPQWALADIVITRVGGERTSLVVDRHALVIDAYTTNWQDGAHEAQMLTAMLAQLPHYEHTRLQYHEVSITALPHPMPDTSNPVLKRTRMHIEVVVKPQFEVLDETDYIGD